MNRKRIFSRFAIIALALAFIFASAAPSQAAAIVDMENIKVPIEPFQVYVPCAAGGAGEDLDLTGPLHILIHLTLDDSGGFHAGTHFQPQGVIGVGQITGDVYHATGETQDQFNGKVGSTYTYVNNFRMIGPGPGNNLLIRENIHITVNSNGEVTAEVDNFKTECK